MKVVLQTVNEASVHVAGKMVSKIGKGYLLLVGFTDGDNETACDLMVDKILKLRCFADENRQINLDIFTVNGEIMSVSQFTLYANTAKGRRPSFVDAMYPMEAQRLYEYFNQKLETGLGRSVSTGIFGADMKVHSINDGPFTLLLDSKELWPKEY